MWVMVMFDLPVTTKAARARYQEFLKVLKWDGFTRIQFSIYARSCPSEENAEVHRKRIKQCLPVEGKVRILTFTDKQFERKHVYFGRTEGDPESQPGQNSFF
jgi:CRISPR-associated protein Cas2